MLGFKQTRNVLLWPVCAAALLTRLEGAFLCVLRSQGEAAPRLSVRQHAAPEACGTQAGQGAGAGTRGRRSLGPEPEIPGAATRGSQGSERPPSPTHEAVAKDNDATPGCADLRQETDRKRRRTGGPRRAENR